ncbi:hypothetical protein MRX96_023634 [Rhipicephalus microplus]
MYAKLLGVHKHSQCALHLSETQFDVTWTQLTRKLVHCVAKNASSWMRPLPDPYSRPPSMSVFVGYPPSEDTQQKMDQKYSAYPAHKLSSNAFLSELVDICQSKE